MSTDDSVSEDVSTSGALSHGHASADGDTGKESEASLVSSEGTSASDRRHTAGQTTGGAVESRAVDIVPACNKIRSLCLSTEEALEQQKNLPFINPSSLETLRALVQEIQSSGETDPEVWKDCEGRWLHLFQLVEKQYQEQILAQQEQYQCQIQLIQDEIKALVQLQNRQTSMPPHSGFPPTPETKPAAVNSDRSAARTPPAHNHMAFSLPPHAPDTEEPAGERTATVLSSGYGTLSTWESSGLEPPGSPGDEDQGAKPRWTTRLQEDAESAAVGRQLGGTGKWSQTISPPGYQQKTWSSSSQQLTSWAQRHRLRTRRTRAGPAEDQEQPHSPSETHTDPQDQRPAAGSSRCLDLRRSDSLLSVASGLTYWRLNECELYHPLPDSFDSGAYLLLQEASPSLEPRLSLREIYHNKQQADWKRSDWDGSVTSAPTSPQVFTLDPGANTRQSDRTSGFTSPSHFSSPSFAAQPLLSPGVTGVVTPDSPQPGDADCISDASNTSAAPGPPDCDVRSSWGPYRGSRTASDGLQRGGSEEEGSHTHTSTLKPLPVSGDPHAEDPVVLSLLRQNLREKHSRHVADLKAYYESEIQTLREKLKLREPVGGLEESNHLLSQRCQHLEEALSEATSRVQHLEAANSSLEKKLAEWPERYAVAGAAVKSLQQRLEESRRSGGEKDGLAAGLRTRLRQLEDEALQARRDAARREEKGEREYKMLQDLLGEYDSLRKEHERTKNNLSSTEDKLAGANDQISELKRVISKLESQVKQIEHENQARARFSSHSAPQPSGAGLFHHPDLLLLPSSGQMEPDVMRRKLACPPAETPAKPALSQSLLSHKRTSYPPAGQSAGSGSPVESSSTRGSRRCASPPESEETRQDAVRREGGGAAVLTPVMRALIELEETRATQSRAPWVGSPRTKVGLVERRHKESIVERGPVQVEQQVEADPGGGGGARSRGGVNKAAALLRTQRSLSPDGHRSSSLPPPGQRPAPPHTPTQRETLLTPLSSRSSPKRCPTDNFSTAFGHMMPRQEHLLTGVDRHLDRRRHSFTSSPRKKLHFSTDREPDAIRALDRQPQLDWEELPVPPGPPVQGSPDLKESCEDSTLVLLDQLQSLADAERLLDELMQEKRQVEAALSRLPASGARVSLQTRLNEAALEKRLERLNRELGSLRMTLKRFHVLRSSSTT